MDQEDIVSCHIRVHPGGWTEKLKSFLELFNPAQKYPFHVRCPAHTWLCAGRHDGRQALSRPG
jgi:hypothetical protein